MHGRSHLTGRLGAFALCILLVFSATPASASPASQIAEARTKAAEARDKLDELAADLEEKSEEYLLVKEELDETRERIRVAEGELSDAQREVDDAEAQLSDRITSIYRRGSIDVLSVFVGVGSFRDLVTRFDLFQRIGRSDAALIARVKTAKERVEETKASLENRRVELVSLLGRAREKKNAVEAALRTQRAYLDTLDAKVKQLVAEERERQERIAREKAEAAARAAAIAAANRAATARGGYRSSDVTDLPVAHTNVVAIARQFIGKTPYVWGGVTPAGFDCSGLTQYVYREVGIAIPRTSRQQYRFGAFIPPDRLDLLQPGDLVFFGRDGDPNRVHHVGIYSGSGNFIHAPQTGMNVTESSLIARIESKADYVGATRP